MLVITVSSPTSPASLSNHHRPSFTILSPSTQTHLIFTFIIYHHFCALYLRTIRQETCYTTPHTPYWLPNLNKTGLLLDNHLSYLNTLGIYQPHVYFQNGLPFCFLSKICHFVFLEFFDVFCSHRAWLVARLEDAGLAAAWMDREPPFPRLHACRRTGQKNFWVASARADQGRQVQPTNHQTCIVNGTYRACAHSEQLQHNP